MTRDEDTGGDGGRSSLTNRIRDRWSALLAWIAKGRQRSPSCGG